MGRRIGKEYGADDIRTATFKLSHQKWESFIERCKGEGRSASDVLIEFVETILNGGDIPTRDDGLGKIREAIEGNTQAIAILQGKLIGLEGEIRALKRPPEPSQTKGDAISPEQKPEPLQGEIEAPIFVDNPDTVEVGELPALDDPNGWDANQLLLRLNTKKDGKPIKSTQTINNKRNKPDFQKWSAERDPDGLAWESRPTPNGKNKAALFPIIGDRQLTPDPKTLTE